MPERLKRHNAGYEISTSPGAPWTLLWQVPKESCNEAMELEKKLKNISRSRLLRMMIKYEQGIVDSDSRSLISDLS